VDAFYAGGGGAGKGSSAAAKKGDTPKLSKLFDEYIDPEQKDNLYDVGLSKFLKDVGLSEENVESLALPWRLECQEQGVISRCEFIEGFSKMGVDTLSKIRAEMEKLKRDLNDPRTFKAFYSWLFDYCTEKKRKTIDKNIAVGLWGVVFKTWPLCQKWINFCLAADEKLLKAVSKDLWLQVLAFTREVKPDLSDYDAESGAWPVVLDVFVEQTRSAL